MNKRGFCSLALGFGLALALSGAAFAEDMLAKVKAAGVLKVGTETEFAPFDFIDAGQHVGLNVDLFDEVGKELGVKIEWVTLPWDGVLPGLEAGKFDMVAGPATITKARMEHYRFTPPIAEATVALLKRKGDETIMKPEDIAGKTVGEGKATAQLAQTKAFGDKLPGGDQDQGICRLQRGLRRSRGGPRRRASAIRCPTSPSSPSRSPTPSRWCCRLSA